MVYWAFGAKIIWLLRRCVKLRQYQVTVDDPLRRLHCQVNSYHGRITLTAASLIRCKNSSGEVLEDCALAAKALHGGHSGEFTNKHVRD